MKRAKQTIVLMTAALGGVALGGGSGCTRDFPPFNRLTGLRVLGIQSDPPDPAPGDPATYSALVYTPPDFPVPTYRWRWCPFPGPAESGYPCVVSEEQIAQQFPGQAAQVPSFDLGVGETATLRNSIDAALLRSLCAGAPGVPPVADCEHGFPFQIELTVNTASADPKLTDEVKAVTTGHWRLDPTTPANNNPTIGTLTATIPLGSPEELGDTPLSAPLHRNVANALEAQILRTAAEPYDGFDDDGRIRPQLERLFVTWFVETGGTDDVRTSFTSTQNGDAPDMAEDDRRFQNLQKNNWGPALKKDYLPDTARLFVVIHDNRGGSSWKSGTVRLETTP